MNQPAVQTASMPGDAVVEAREIYVSFGATPALRGASVSVISDEVASLGGVKNYIKGEKMRVIGSAGVTDEVPSLVLPRVSFGKHSRSSIAAIALDLDAINEASGFEQAGILGGNFLKNYRLTFDFKNSKVTFFPLTPDK